MTNWNVSTFFQKFQEGTLGRKSQYSTYWINSFDSCNILCNKSSGYRGSRDGEKIVAIYMGPDLCIFNSGEFTGTQDFMPRFTMSLDKIGMESITESGILDIHKQPANNNVKTILFQIGDTYYLIEPYWSEKFCVNYGVYMQLPSSGVDIMAAYQDPSKKSFTWYGFNVYDRKVRGANLVKLSEKYHTIKEARLAVIPDEAKADPINSFVFRNWWFTPQPTYTPFALQTETKALLKNPPMPWEYGLTVDAVWPILCGQTPIEANLPKVRENMSKQTHQNITRYMKDKALYEAAISKLRSTFVDQDDEKVFGQADIAILPSSTAEYGIERVGEEREDGKGKYYVKGALHDKQDQGHVGFRYGGIERLVKTNKMKDMLMWHSMVRGVGHV